MSADTQGWKWFGRAGHFVGADRCQWHLHTHVTGTDGREYCISSVGEYFPRDVTLGAMEEVGPHRLYETFVFTVGDDGEPSEWDEIDSTGYVDLADAEAGHMEMARKWAERTPEITVEDDE